VALVRWCLASLGPYRRRAAAVVALSLAEIGLAALGPWPLKVVIDNVLGDLPLPAWLAALVLPVTGPGAVALLLLMVAAGFTIQLGGELVRAIHTQLQMDVGQRLVYDLRARLLAHLQALPLRHHLQGRTADSVYRLDADAYSVNDLVIGGVFPLAMAAVNLAVMFAILLRLDAMLAVLALGVVPPLYFSLRFYASRMADRAERVKALESRLLERAFEVLSSVAAVKSFARESHEVDRFTTSGRDTLQARLTLTWQESLFSVTVTAITLGGTALVLAVGGLHVLDGRLTVGGLLVVVAYLAAVYNPLSAIAHTAGSLQEALVSARRVREVFALAPEPLDVPGALDASAIEGRVRFDRVRFAYDADRDVLSDVSFEARPGELVALVGVTGAGKTTALSLIPRFFEPSAGRVLIDDLDVARYSLRSLRERIALVPQSPVLFTGTVADNIRYGRLDATDAEVAATVHAAHLDDVVARLPQGVDTTLAEGGATLSGGERQRLGLARALIKPAPILILDEPTSSLDALSEAAVFDALRRARAGRTVLVIAHRLSTIRDATRIVVLHDGRVAAQGTHDELLSSSDLYRRMCARLAMGRSLDGIEADTAAIRALA